MTERDYLSIGEVLAELLEEFPDITISKIRFLESQGLIEPERTPSGYRKFTGSEVERLRFILREQRNNYLPLRIIRSKLGDDTSPTGDLRVSPEDVTTSGHPAARGLARPMKTESTPDVGIPEQDIPLAISDRDQRMIAVEHADRTESIPRDELIRHHDIDPSFLLELEQAGLVTGHDVGDTTFFDAESAEIADVASRFRALGIDARHLRGWKSAADRELGLYEQRILPLLRQRNPNSRAEALSMLEEFVDLGDKLRTLILQRGISRLTEQR